MYLLDTNVVSELRRVRFGRADPGVAAWADQVDAAILFLSVITIHELDLGVRLMERRDPVQGTLLRQWFAERVLPAFENRILPVDSEVVVTRNVSDFDACGVDLLNPWSGAVESLRPGGAERRRQPTETEECRLPACPRTGLVETRDPVGFAQCAAEITFQRAARNSGSSPPLPLRRRRGSPPG